MDNLTLDGNPGWVDSDSADGDLILAAIEHGGSVASITLEMSSHTGDPRVETGVELTADDCRRLMARLALITGD